MTTAIEARIAVLERSFAAAAREPECKVGWLKTRVSNLIALSKRDITAQIESKELLDSESCRRAMFDVGERVRAVSKRLSKADRFKLFNSAPYNSSANKPAEPKQPSKPGISALHRVRDIVEELASKAADDDQREIQLFELIEYISKGIDSIDRIRTEYVSRPEFETWRAGFFGEFLNAVERFVDDAALLAMESELYALPTEQLSAHLQQIADAHDAEPDTEQVQCSPHRGPAALAYDMLAESAAGDGPEPVTV